MTANAAEASLRLRGDDFQEGFSVAGTNAKWSYFSVGPYIANDGLATTSVNGLHVVASAINPQTGVTACQAAKYTSVKRSVE
jgi:hypothetical protein